MASPLGPVSGPHETVLGGSIGHCRAAQRNPGRTSHDARSARSADCRTTLHSRFETRRLPHRTATAPAPEILRTAARKLFEAGDKESARKILELVFAREIAEHQLVAANFLGLAEIRLASGDTAGALDLLHRLVIAVGNPFENLDPAAALLEKTGHNAEAIEFLDQLVKSSPWDPSYRLRLAKAKLAANNEAATAQTSLATIASASNTPYDLRLKAAAALAGRPHSDLGSGELNLLAASSTAITSKRGRQILLLRSARKGCSECCRRADEDSTPEPLHHRFPAPRRSSRPALPGRSGGAVQRIRSRNHGAALPNAVPP